MPRKAIRDVLLRGDVAMDKAKKRRWFLVPIVPMTAGDTGEMVKACGQTTHVILNAIRHSIAPGHNGEGGTVAEFLAWALSLVFVQIVLHQLWS